MSVRDLRYVAPEQLRDEAVSAATDVQTLGLILCELLTGRLPYPDVDRVGDLLRQRLTTAPSAVADVGAGMPSAVAAVLDRALLADPVQRQPSAVELAASLFEGAAACYGSDALLLAGPLSAVAVAELRVARITNAWKP